MSKLKPDTNTHAQIPCKKELNKYYTKLIIALHDKK
jgi:hypothetical protein